MTEKNGNKFVKRFGWVIQMVFGVVAILNIRVPTSSGSRALGEVLFTMGTNTDHGPWVERLLNLLEKLNGCDEYLLNGGTRFSAGTAAGIAVASILVFSLLWISRWFDKERANRVVDRILESAVNPLFVACALVSPSTAMAMALAQSVFQYCYPPQRDLFVVGIDPHNNVITPPVKIS